MPRLPKQFFRTTDKVRQVLAEDDFRKRTPQIVLCKPFNYSDLRCMFGVDFGSFC
jgi:hypothetical protein